LPGLDDLLLGQRGDGAGQLFEHLDAFGQEALKLFEGVLFDVAGPELRGGPEELVDVDGDLVLVEPGLERGPAFGIEAVGAARNPPCIVGLFGRAVARPPRSGEKVKSSGSRFQIRSLHDGARLSRLCPNRAVTSPH
jgi:hypothetical protein